MTAATAVAEILLGPGDRIILGDDSVPNLEARAYRLVPATLYSRMQNYPRLLAGAKG